MMQDGIDHEARLLLDGLNAVDGRAMLAVGPHAAVQAHLCAAARRMKCVAVGCEKEPIGSVVETPPLSADDLWRMSPAAYAFDLIAVDRVYPPALLFGIFSSVAPLLNRGGILLVHSYSDFMADEPYHHQNDSLVAIASFLSITPDFARRALAGQVVEISRRRMTDGT